MKLIRTPLSYLVASLVACLGLVFSLSATAQYIWLDAAGRKVFSDQPPPPNIVSKRILQQPGKAPAPLPVASAEEAASADGQDKPKTEEVAAKTAPAPKIASKDKDLEAAKKKIDDEAASKKKADDEVRNVAKADNCVRAKQAKTTLDSGVRLTTTNAKGERGYMDEATRTVETKRLEGIIAVDCK